MRSLPLPLRSLALLGLLMAALGCTTDSPPPDAGTPTVGGITLQDIGSRCVCELQQDQNGVVSCKVAPTNTCARTALTCVVDAFLAGVPSNAGHPLWESGLFTRMVPVDGGANVEGECTLVYARNQVSPSGRSTDYCPEGSRLVLLSTGMFACKRTCTSDSECQRDGWVCDAPFLSEEALRAGREEVFNQRFCRPACQRDFPDCNRSTVCVLGQSPACSASALTGVSDLGIYVGDRFGTRVCDVTTGHCVDRTLQVPSAFVGSPCQSHQDCPEQFMCIPDSAYNGPIASGSDGTGFCTYAGCDPAAMPNAAGSCVAGYTCEHAFEMGMCFPDCQGGTLCGQSGQKCAAPPGDRLWSFDPATGAARQFKGARCVDCDSTGTCP